MKRDAFRKGVTLVEVLVASLILVITIGSSLMIFLQYEKNARENFFRTQANEWAADYFEEMYAKSTPTAISAFVAEYAAAKNKTYSIFDENGTDTGKKFKIWVTSTTKTFATANVSEITVNITWDITGKQESLTLTTRTRG